MMAAFFKTRWYYFGLSFIGGFDVYVGLGCVELCGILVWFWGLWEVRVWCGMGWIGGDRVADSCLLGALETFV